MHSVGYHDPALWQHGFCLVPSKQHVEQDDRPLAVALPKEAVSQLDRFQNRLGQGRNFIRTGFRTGCEPKIALANLGRRETSWHRRLRDNACWPSPTVIQVEQVRVCIFPFAYQSIVIMASEVPDAPPHEHVDSDDEEDEVIGGAGAGAAPGSSAAGKRKRAEAPKWDEASYKRLLRCSKKLFETAKPAVYKDLARRQEARTLLSGLRISSCLVVSLASL